jgi:endonuclease-3
MANNFDKVFFVFRKHYKQIPLEVFAKNPYKTLISTILSSRTKDETTFKVSKKLFLIAPDIKKLNLLKTKEIRNLIYPVGFYKTKAKQLKIVCLIINKHYKGEIPNSREELLTLPGVGIKTANLVLNRSYGRPAIAVDTHVHKISNLLGWVKTKTPEETERELMKILPKRYWKDINRQFVSIGRQYRSKDKLVNFLRENKLL